MLAPVPWFKRLSKIVLECTPVAAALLIGLYLVANHDWSGQPQPNVLAVQPDAGPAEKADAAALITSTHASLVPGKVTPPVIEPRERIVETPPPPEPKPHSATTHKPAAAKTAQRTPAAAGTRVATAEPAADRGIDLPPPAGEPAAAEATEPKPEEKKSWGRRIAEATYLKDAADITVNASMTVARVSVETFDKVTSAAGSLIPDFRK
ncbi:MAG TPA: hypothetical protein VGD36_07300 [Xanthobacteraceae bacterium]